MFLFSLNILYSNIFLESISYSIVHFDQMWLICYTTHLKSNTTLVSHEAGLPHYIIHITELSKTLNLFKEKLRDLALRLRIITPLAFFPPM